MSDEGKEGITVSLDPDLYGYGNSDPFLEDEDKLSIAQLIPKILVERKSFTNITEEMLENEINNESGSSPASIKADEGSIDGDMDEEETNGTSKVEEWQKNKIELSKNIGMALNETSLSLDFVSLLLSSVKPNVAKSSMSPHLSKTVPLGSLNAERLSTDDSEDSSKTSKLSDNAALGQGWKNQSIEKIIEYFRDASTSMNEQILKERQFWNTANVIRHNGEVLYKTRDPVGGARTIGIKYGFGDSGSTYYDKGLAILRNGNGSEVAKFEPLPPPGKIPVKVYKYVRVKILSKIDDDYMLTGQSTFQNDFSAKKYNIINEIDKARFFLFEEDLFHNLTREAKYLMEYNVSIISNKIIIEIGDDIIEIESIPYYENDIEESDNLYQNINNFSSINNRKAQLILKYFKIMLCCYYNYSLSLKQKVPTSYTKWKAHNSHPLILRPFMGGVRHENNMKAINYLMQDIRKKFEKQFDIEVDLKKYSNLEKQTGNPFQKSIEKPVTIFSMIFKSKVDETCLQIELELTSNENFVITLMNLGIIKYQNEDARNSNTNGVNILQNTFYHILDLKESFEWSLYNLSQ